MTPAELHHELEAEQEAVVSRSNYLDIYAVFNLAPRASPADN